MRAVPILLLLLIFWACDGRKTSSDKIDSMQISITMDTVVVDPGEDILAAGSSMFAADISPDKKYLINLDQKNLQLEIVDLDNLVLLRKVTMEKEGPNGIGGYVNYVICLPDQKVAFTSFMNSSIFNWQGEKSWETSFGEKSFQGDELNDEESLNPRYLFNDNQNFYTFVSNFKSQSSSIAKINIGSDSLKKIPVPELKKLDQFRILFEEGGGMSLQDQSVYLEKWGENVLISNSGFNEISIYHPDGDSVSHKKYQSQFTENGKKGNYRTKVSSREEYRAESSIMRKEISFNKWNWDESTQQFYRFSHYKDPGEDEANSKTHVFLTVFDDQLNMLGETKVEGYQKPPESHFTKDGKIYIYENIEDELGFIVLNVLME